MKQLGWAMALCVALCASSARADDESSRREAAKALVAQGTALYGEGAYADALKKFRAAYDIFPNPKIYFDIAQASSHLNDKVAAANAFQSFLDQTLEAADIAGERATAREQLARLVQKLGRITVAPEPADAEVRVDGNVLHEKATFVAPGSHQVAVSRAGYEGNSQYVEVHAAENRSVQVILKAEAKPQVTVAPAPPLDVPRLKENEPALRPSPAGGISARAPERHSTASYALMGGGAGAVVVGSLVGLLALSDNSKLHDVVGGDLSAGTPDDAPGLRTRIKAESLVSTVAVGLGIAAVGAGAYLFFTDEPSTTPDDSVHADTPAGS